MINTPQQCIDFITSSEFPLPEKFSAFEKPWSEAPYYWSYRSIWPGMNYRIEIAPEEEFVQVRFFGEDWRIIELPEEGIEKLIPLQWNKKVRVERYEQG